MHITYNSTYCIASNYKQDFFDFMVEHFGVLSEDLTPEEEAIPILKSSAGYFRTVGPYLWFYSGFLTDVMRHYKAEKITIKSEVSKYTSFNFTFPKFLYAHQKKILTSIIKKKRGLVQSPTGSGKSFVIAELVRRFYTENITTVITVPTIDLLNQLKEDIINYFKLCNESIYPAAIGLIGGGNMDVDLNTHKIFIGIPQSLSKINKTKKVLENCEALIADEVHTTATNTYATVVDICKSTKIRIGLSATPWTNQDNHILLKGFFGDLICQVTESDMIESNVIMEPNFIFLTSPKGFVPQKIGEFACKISDLNTGHRYKVLNQVYNYLILNNSGRNKLIVDKAIERSRPDLGPVIIIVNKVNDTKGKVGHATILKTMFESRGKVVSVISGSVKKKDRVKIIQDLKDNKLDIVIAGPKVLTAGVNIPSLSTAILAGAGKSDTDLIQRIGRILRKQKGKEAPLVIDFMDTQFWFENQSYKRMNVIKSVYGESNLNVI